MPTKYLLLVLLISLQAFSSDKYVAHFLYELNFRRPSELPIQSQPYARVSTASGAQILREERIDFDKLNARFLYIKVEVHGKTIKIVFEGPARSGASFKATIDPNKEVFEWDIGKRAIQDPEGLSYEHIKIQFRIKSRKAYLLRYTYVDSRVDWLRTPHINVNDSNYRGLTVPVATGRPSFSQREHVKDFSDSALAPTESRLDRIVPKKFSRTELPRVRPPVHQFASPTNSLVLTEPSLRVPSHGGSKLEVVPTKRNQGSQKRWLQGVTVGAVFAFSVSGAYYLGTRSHTEVISHQSIPVGESPVQSSYTLSQIALKYGERVPEGRVAVFIATSIGDNVDQLLRHLPQEYHANLVAIRSQADQLHVIADRENDLSRQTIFAIGKLLVSLKAQEKLLNKALRIPRARPYAEPLLDFVNLMEDRSQEPLNCIDPLIRMGNESEERE